MKIEINIPKEKEKSFKLIIKSMENMLNNPKINLIKIEGLDLNRDEKFNPVEASFTNLQ